MFIFKQLWAARRICIAAVFILTLIQRVSAGVITFSDQPTGNQLMQTTPYDSTRLNGLPNGVTLTFSAPSGDPGFEEYNGTKTITDHTHLMTPADLSNEFIFADTATATISFNVPVDVVSLFVNRNTSLGANNSRTVTKPQPTVTGYLNQVQVFSFTNTAAANTWLSVTGGTVDSLVFSAFVDNMIDDIDIELPTSAAAGAPEPSSAFFLSVTFLGLSHRRRPLIKN